MDTSFGNNEVDDLDGWFNDLDDTAIQIISKKLITPETDDEKNERYDDSDANLSGIQLRQDTETDYATKCICIDDIIKTDPEPISSNELMQYECSISYFIQVLIENSDGKAKFNRATDAVTTEELNFDKLSTIVEYLEWISAVSELLCKRIGQQMITTSRSSSTPTIVRSSYNFCNKYHQCKKFYSKQDIPSCKEHHYVHALLKYDVDSVIAFIRHILKRSSGSIFKEEIDDIYISIKTICYVTRHMAKEISYIDYITKSNSETYHRNNPIEISRPKITTFKDHPHSNSGAHYHGASSSHYHSNPSYKPRFHDRKGPPSFKSRNQRDRQRPHQPAEPKDTRNIYDVLSDFHN